MGGGGGQSASPRHGMLWSFLKGDALPIAGELREASAGWCGTGGGSGPQRGRPCGATAPSDSALFLAASLEPAQWIPGSVETRASRHV